MDDDEKTTVPIYLNLPAGATRTIGVGGERYLFAGGVTQSVPYAVAAMLLAKDENGKRLFEKAKSGYTKGILCNHETQRGGQLHWRAWGLPYPPLRFS